MRFDVSLPWILFNKNRILEIVAIEDEALWNTDGMLRLKVRVVKCDRSLLARGI